MKHSLNKQIKKRFSLRPMMVVTIGFLIVILIGTFFLSLPISNTDGEWLGFTDSFFTATSAVCVTGLIVRPTATAFNGFGQAVIMLLIQIGGLGIMTITTMLFILIRKRITLKDRVALQEALGQERMKGIVRLVRNIIIMTAIIELTGAIALMPFLCVKNGAIGVWQSIFTSVSAFCNAGFDIFGTAENPYASLTAFRSNPGVLLIIGFLIILGGLGFTVICDIFDCKFKFRKYKFHTKIVLIVSLSLLIFGSLFFFASEYNSPAFADMNFGEKLLNGTFQSITSRTAGFNSVDQTALSRSGSVMTCALMFIGAAPGGTGGGIKTTTFAVLILMGVSGLRGKDEIVISMRSINFKTGMRAVAVIMLATLLIVLCGTTVVALSGDTPSAAIFFDTISAFSNTGLSVGTTTCAPTISDLSLYILDLVMFIGRLGPLSIGLMFSKQDHSGLKFPPANIMIG